MVGNEDFGGTPPEIILPHWSIVGDTTVYYLYNQQGSTGVNMIVNAPYIEGAGQDADQMIFQGNDTLINPDDNKQLIIPPNGTAIVIIQAQYYTVMNDPTPTPIETYISTPGTYDYTSDKSQITQSTIMVGNEDFGGTPPEIILPHWSIVGDTTVYYLYNQQGSTGVNMIVNAPYIEGAGQDADQMIFQGNDTLINPDDNKQLIIPPNGTAIVIIQAQYYTVMNYSSPDNYYTVYNGSLNLDTIEPLEVLNPTIEARLSYVQGQNIKFQDDNGTNYLIAQVINYNSSSGEIMFVVREVVGTAEGNVWIVNLADGAEIYPFIQTWYSDNGGNLLDYTSTPYPDGTTYMYGSSATTNILNIKLPHWTIVGDGVVYYLYNQNGSQNFVLDAPFLDAPTGAQMIFQGNSTFIDSGNNQKLIIPPNGSVVLVIIGQYYTVMSQL